MRLRHLLLLTQLPFWALLLFAFLNLQSGLESRVQTLARSSDTRSQLEAVNALLTHVVNMETGVRGYVIAGQASFLEPYYRGEAAYPPVLKTLSRDAQLPAQERARLGRIGSVIRQWQTEVAQPEIRARPSQPEVAEALVRSGRGKRLLDAVRADVDALSQNLAAQLSVSDARAQRQLQALRRDLMIAAAVLLALSVATTLGAARMLTHPLSDLGRGARRITDTSGSVTVTERGPREYRDLASTFNRMTERIREARQATDQAVSQLERRNTWLSDLARLSDALQAARTLSEASEILTRALPHLLPHTSGQLLQHNASRNLLLQAAQWGEPLGTPGPDTCWALRRGETQGEAAGQPFMPRCSDQTGPYLCAPLFSHGETLGLLRIRPPAGADLSAQRAALDDVTRQVALALASLRLQDRLLQQSIRDPLTGLFNRRHLEAQLSAGVTAANATDAPLSLIALDIDHFKRLNDTFGHDAGDAALIRVSATLRDLAPTGSTPARPGGEEFTLLLPQTDLRAAQALAEQLRSAVEGLHLTHDGLPLGQVTVSLGVASLTAGVSGEGLVAAADQALYAAKRSGRNRVMAAT
ncbi:diguanylate cyclase [Deinococcus radiotolerans]|uniref:diguanylate cyclase n=1 Tax=Deinococcus radiotolerans TaxID=1309407 RepID=UPI00166E76D3|nr:diguanylate cyclase [Deinococcus radiotolerans]